MGRLGQGLYPAGMVALAAGIALEIYGFSIRVRISGWAPVTNMYETVIWVALVAAALSFIFELIFRRTYLGAGRARPWPCSGTITAVNVPLAGPQHQEPAAGLAEQLLADDPCARPMVSSYAAFGLAWGLGLIAHGLLPDGHLPPITEARRTRCSR